MANRVQLSSALATALLLAACENVGGGLRISKIGDLPYPYAATTVSNPSKYPTDVRYAQYLKTVALIPSKRTCEALLSGDLAKRTDVGAAQWRWTGAPILGIGFNPQAAVNYTIVLRDLAFGKVEAHVTYADKGAQVEKTFSCDVYYAELLEPSVWEIGQVHYDTCLTDGYTEDRKCRLSYRTDGLPGEAGDWQ